MVHQYLFCTLPITCQKLFCDPIIPSNYLPPDVLRLFDQICHQATAGEVEYKITQSDRIANIFTFTLSQVFLLSNICVAVVWDLLANHVPNLRLPQLARKITMHPIFWEILINCHIWIMSHTGMYEDFFVFNYNFYL